MKNNKRLLEKGNAASLFTASDVVVMLSICNSTLYNWERKGLLKPVRLGKKRYYKSEDIVNFINK